jgi:hypothetical protein
VYDTVDFEKVLVNNMQTLPPSHKVIPIIRFLRTPLIIAFNYVTFAAIWTGRFHVKAVDYERYIIFELHPFYTNESKSVPCEYLKYIRK